MGKVAPGKPTTKDGIPVLTKGEIDQLTEWLFSTLPGATIIQHPQDVPKWNYQPQDVIKEMQQEGDQLKSKQTGTSESPLSNLQELRNSLPDGHEYIAALGPAVPQRTKEKKEEMAINEIFDVVPNPQGSPDKYSYYIKHKYYTDENIEAAKEFFEVYCATCHGAEADGMGARAAVMQDAKPRMLTDLDWLDTHDDLYLLRSIKYGVPGTAMTPWGDQTNSLYACSW